LNIPKVSSWHIAQAAIKKPIACFHEKSPKEEAIAILASEIYRIVSAEILS
jgi:hypothetical protein